MNEDTETLGVHGEAVFTKKEIKDMEARYHEGYEVVRRLLLYVLTRNTRELATNIRKDPKLQEACADPSDPLNTLNGLITIGNCFSALRRGCLLRWEPRSHRTPTRKQPTEDIILEGVLEVEMNEITNALFKLFGILSVLLFLVIFGHGQVPSFIVQAFAWCFVIWLLVCLWGTVEFVIWLIFGDLTKPPGG